MTLNPGSLFRPLKVHTLELRNRVVMAPMTRQFAVDGVLKPEVEEYYGRRADGGAGLIVTEATTIEHEVAHFTRQAPYFYGAESLVRWRAVVARVHRGGAAIFPQLWHTGLNRQRGLTYNPEIPSMAPSLLTAYDLVAPGAVDSPLNRRDEDVPVAMTKQNIREVIDAYGQAGATARRVGFDGVAIHAAHGFLPDMFFWERSNRRTDAYGGGVEGRMRFGVELVQEIRRLVGPDFPIMLRFSQWKGFDYSAKLAATPQQLEKVLQPLAAAGVDIFDASTRRFWQPEFEGSPLNLAGWAKKLTGKVAMTVGSIGLENPLERHTASPRMTSVSIENLRVLVEMMDRGDVDLAAVGRGMISNPNWSDLVRAGRLAELRAYDPASIVSSLEPVDLLG